MLAGCGIYLHETEDLSIFAIWLFIWLILSNAALTITFDYVIYRVRDLMRSGVLKLSEKPIWYDVYGAFPPKRDPLHLKPHTRPCIMKQNTVWEIFYKEDEVRA